jgi:hypothetical protein
MAQIDVQKINLPMMDSVAQDSGILETYFQGGAEVLHQVLPFNSYSNNSFTTTIYSPSSDVLIGRNIMITAVVDVDLGAGNFTDNLNHCLCAYPLNSIITSANVSINGNTTTSQPQQLLKAMQFNQTEDHKRKWSTMSPTQLDPTSSPLKHPASYRAGLLQLTNNANADIQVYNSAGAAAVTAYAAHQVYNPESPFSRERVNPHSRRSFPFTVQTADRVRRYVFTEPLLHPLFSDDEQTAMVNVREMRLDLRFDTSIRKMFCSADGSQLAGLSINLVAEAPSVNITYVRPPAEFKIPAFLSVPYTDHQINIQNSSLGLTPNATTTERVSNLTYSVVPKKFYIFCGSRESQVDERDSHSVYAVINSLKITVGTKANLLSGLSQQGLYNMSVKNGLNMSWKAWSESIGSVVIIDCDEDLGISSGQIGRISVSIEASLTNKAYRNGHSFVSVLNPSEFSLETGDTRTNWDFYTVACINGRYEISPSVGQLKLGLSSFDVQEAEEDNEILGEGYDDTTGGFMLPLAAFMMGRRMGSGVDGEGGRLGGSWKSVKKWYGRNLRKPLKNIGNAVLDGFKESTAQELTRNNRPVAYATQPMQLDPLLMR